MQKQQEQDSEISTLHGSWMRNPITEHAMIIIRNHKHSFIKSLSRDATNPDVTDEQIRMNAVGMKTCDAILILLENSTNFKLSAEQLNNL